MFYEPGKTSHNLPHDPFKACVVPRPIGWISTTSALKPGDPSSAAQHNLAPYSQFNNLTFDPPYVMFSANQTPDHQRKDSVRNAEQTGKFCWNLATWALRHKVNITAEQVPYGVDEFDRAGLAKCFSTTLPGDGDGNPVPMVAESPVRFECVYHSTLRLPGNPPMGSVDIVIGRVVGVHIADEVLTDGKLDIRKTEPIARCGYYEYTVVRETFDMVIPGMNEATLAGLEGSTRRHKALAEGEAADGGGEVID
ncbi:2-nitrobenzoate nitroreductase [Microdochium nivale]|nr:2-nitrobenzoate nitroreductase [Microdochium nivale]